MILDKKNQNKNIGKVDFGVLYTILILLAIGVVMIYSASSFYSMFHYNDSMFYLKKQGIMAVIGLLAMFFMMNFDYHRLKKITPKLLIITVPLLIAVFFFPAGHHPLTTRQGYRMIKDGTTPENRKDRST